VLGKRRAFRQDTTRCGIFTCTRKLTDSHLSLTRRAVKCEITLVGENKLKIDMLGMAPVHGPGHDKGIESMVGRMFFLQKVGYKQRVEERSYGWQEW